MAVIICPAPFDPWEEIRKYRESSVLKSGSVGATNIFIGTMRDFNEGDKIQSMTLDYYPGMTEKQLGKILEEAGNRWAVVDSLIVHRVAEIKPDEAIVVVAVWSSHRGDAFDACRFIMEALKSNAPFWKKELLDTGQTRWVEKNTDGYQKNSP